ncbi:hypothetical protein IV102_23890 [bacterium]|nr:hypothetical protein [bacterium]
MGRRLIFILLVCLLFLAASAWTQGPGDEQKCSDNLQLLLRSLAKYGKDHQNHYPDKLQDLVPRYLSQLPACPAGGATYARYSVIRHDPERAVLICSYPSHNLKPPDYIVLSGDRGSETPFSRLADPSICRRTLVQLGVKLEQEKARLGQYPQSLVNELRCSCGDAIQYHPLEAGKSYVAYCPGAAHLGSGLAPFSPYLTPAGLKEDNLVIGPPLPPAQPLTGLSRSSLAALGVAVSILLVLFVLSMRRKRIQLD